MNQRKHLQESCGIFAAIKPESEPAAKKTTLLVYDGLKGLQHRGQDSAGVTALTEYGLKTRRVTGLVNGLKPYLGELGGRAVIGHVRYPTTGRSLIENAQPVQFKDFSIAFNGNISNYATLRKELEGGGAKFESDVDVEVIGQLVQKHLRGVRGRNLFVNALRQAMKRLKGSYSVVLLTKKGELFAARDPYGYKPLVLARHGNGLVVSSESHALEKIGLKKFREVKPGAILSLDPSGVKEFAGLDSTRLAHCAFEWIYFAHRESKLSGVKVKDARRRLGEMLAKKNLSGDVVVPVPNSGIQSAHGVAAGLGVPLVHAIRKTGLVGVARTFIAPTQAEREELARKKYEVVDRKAVEGKRVILVDDSIVRGTSMPVLVKLLRDAGATEVHIAASAPEIKSPCFMGINFPTGEELIAWRKPAREVFKQINDSVVGEHLARKPVKGRELRRVLAEAGKEKVDQLRAKLGASSLTYTNITDLIKAIGLPGKLCTACFNTIYPEEERKLKTTEK